MSHLCFLNCYGDFIASVTDQDQCKDKNVVWWLVSYEFEGLPLLESSGADEACEMLVSCYVRKGSVLFGIILAVK